MEEQQFVTRKHIQDAGLFQQRQPILRHLDIELTERCNNACLHCYINLAANDLQAAQRELTTDQWKDILCQAAELGALSVQFTGGEPLLRLDFAELYRYARRLGMKVTLFTNGRLFTPELANLFTQIPPLQKIEISVYGMQAESYEAVACMPGAYTEFRDGIELLLERKIPFAVKSVLLPPNRDEIEEFETWAKNIPGMDRNPAYAVFLDLRARRDSPAKNRLIQRLRFTPQQAVAFINQRGEDYYRSMSPFITGFLRPQGERLFTCGAGESGCVDAYGAYQMCMPLRHPDLVYDLKNGSLRQALTEVFPRWREMQATNPDYLNRCARCFLKGLCEQCPGKSWTEHGTLDTPVEYLCQVAHAQAVDLGLLTAGESAWEVTDWKQRTKIRDQSVNVTLDMSHIPTIPHC